MSNDSIENQTNFHFAISLYRFLPISILLLDPSMERKNRLRGSRPQKKKETSLVGRDTVLFHYRALLSALYN